MTKKITTSKQTPESGESKIKFISKLMWGLGESFLTLEKSKKETEKWLDEQSLKAKAELIKVLNFLRIYDDKVDAAEILSVLKLSPEYQEIKKQKKEVQEKKGVAGQLEEQFSVLEKDVIKKLKGYVRYQETSLKKIDSVFRKGTPEELKKTLAKACEDWIFTIADTFVTQDNLQSVYKNTSWDKRPEYVKWEMRGETISKTMKLLCEIQERDPAILKESWVVAQIQESIHDRKLNVEKNVQSKTYNDYTRSAAIRDRELRMMLAFICTEDASVINDMTAIFDLLIEQRHQDGTNSSSFQYAVRNGMFHYISKNMHFLGKDISFTMNLMKYAEGDFRKEIGMHDIDSKFWMDILVAGIQDSKSEKLCFDLLDEAKKAWRIAISSVFPDAKFSQYIEFVRVFFQAKKYLVRKEWTVDCEKIIAELHAAYKSNVAYKEEVKRIREITINKAKSKAQEIFNKLSREWKKEYFSKAYKETRWQTHSTGMHSFRQFKEIDAMAVISEHSYYGSRWGIERDSKLCVYVEGGTLKASTGNQNYRDRFESAKDNYNNQYIEVLDIKKETEEYVVTVKTWAGNKKIVKMSPKQEYKIDMKILSELSSVEQADKDLLIEALKYQEKLSDK